MCDTVPVRILKTDLVLNRLDIYTTKPHSERETKNKSILRNGIIYRNNTVAPSTVNSSDLKCVKTFEDGIRVVR